MLTLDLFNDTLPAFRTPGSEVYTKMQSFIREQQAHLQQLIDTTRASDTLLQRLDIAAIHRAAHIAIPHLDLVLTPTGFGIVSNQSTAPASRERVESLRESLRHTASIHEDILLTQAVRERVLQSPATIVDTLLWHPSLLTAYGITTPDGSQIYYEEYRALIPQIQAAQSSIATHTISPELLDILITRQHRGDESSVTTTQRDIYDRITHLTRQAIAARLTHQPPQRIIDLSRQLLDTLRLNLGNLPAYATSRTRAAHDHTPYRNKRDDTTYFFG